MWSTASYFLKRNANLAERETEYTPEWSGISPDSLNMMVHVVMGWKYASQWVIWEMIT